MYNNQFIIMFWGGRYCVWGRSFSPSPPPVDKTLVMCAVVQQTLSEYYYKLDSKSKARYFEKTVLIRNDDPYAMEKSKFCLDVSRLPALRLVVYSPGIKAVVILSTFF